MKKIILSISIVLLLILCIITLVSGMPILGIKSIGEIQQKNEEIDQIIANATKVASTDYNLVLENIKQNLTKLQDEKKSYEEALDAVSTTDEEGKKTIITAQKYEIEYLWAVVGHHAKSEGVEIKMDLKAGVSSGLYNLEFTVKGEYIEISDFVASLENDPVLGFKVEGFKLLPNGENNLEATFTCKNIQITEVSSTSPTSSTSTTTGGTNNQTTTNGQTTQNNTTTQQTTNNGTAQQTQNTTTTQTQGTQSTSTTTAGNGQAVTQIQ